MKNLLLLLILPLVFGPAVFAQVDSVQQSTKRINSPAIFASSVSIAYGIRPEGVRNLVQLFEEEGMNPEQRRIKAVQLVAKFRAVQGDPTSGKVDEATIRRALGKELEPKVIQIFTQEANSPAIFASGDASVSYGMSDDAFWGLYEVFERNQVSLDGWEEKFQNQVERFNTLGKELEVRAQYDPVAKQAKELLDKGDIPGAERILVEDVFSLNKSTAYRNYEAAQVRELNLKYRDTTTILCKYAATLEKENTIYLNDYGLNLLANGQYNEAAEQFELAISLDEVKYGVNSLEVAIRKNNLGTAYNFLGEYDLAIAYYHQALNIANQFYNEEDLFIAKVFNNLGNSSQEQGKFSEAIHYLNQSLTIDTTLLGSNHPEVAAVANNLGLTYTKDGNYDKGIYFLSWAFSIDSSAYGMKHPALAVISNNLGAIHQQLGNYPMAVKRFEQALGIDSVIFGNEHPNVARDLNNIGTVHERMMEYDKAISLYKQALNIDSTSLGSEHPYTVRDLNNLGSAYVSQKNYEIALPLLEKTHAINQSLYDPYHPDIAKSSNNLGFVHQAMGNYEQAIQLHEKALAIDTVIYGKDHPDVAIDYKNLGLLFKKIGEYDRSIGYYQQALEIDSKVFGPDHPEISKDLNSLGNVCYRKGDHAAAITFHEKALAVDLDFYGQDHLELAKDFHNLGLAYKAMGDIELGIHFYQKALKLIIKYPSPSQDNFRTTQINLALAANSYGMQFYQEAKWDTASRYFQMGLSASLAVADSSFAITCLNNLGASNKYFTRYDSALYFLDRGIGLANQLDTRTMETVSHQLSDSMLNLPHVQENLHRDYLHTSVLGRMHFHKASTLWRMGRKKTAKPIFQALWEGAVEREDERLIEEIKAEGYIYE